MLSESIYRSVAIASLLAITGCNTEVTTITTSALEDKQKSLEGKLTIDSWTDKELSGVFESELGAVKFFAVDQSPEKVTATAFVNNTQIDMYITAEEGGGHIGFRVHGGELDEAAHGLLTGIHDALAREFPYPEEGESEDRAPEHARLLRSYLGYLSEAPMRLDNEVYDTKIHREVLRPNSDNPPPPKDPPSPTPTPTPTPACTMADVADNDGVSMLPMCCFGRATVLESHDNIPGGHCFQTTPAVCGGSSPTGCAGRCGPGCSAAPGYFQDCFDHDMCLSHDAPAASGFSPADSCGDEWLEGVDDFGIAYAIFTKWIWWGFAGGPCQ